jgi:hypothetical protein
MINVGIITNFCMLFTKYFYYIVFQHPVAHHLFSLMEIDSLSCGLDYKMFTRKRCHCMFWLN